MSDEADQPILPESSEELREFALRQYRENQKLREENRQQKNAYQQKSQQYEKKSREYEAKTEALESKVQEYLELHEKYEILRQAFFGRSSEKWPAEDKLQASLFNEAEVAADEPADEEAECQQIHGYTRKKRGKRKPFPETLPREEIVHDISEEEKVCACGAELVKIGEEVSEKLEIIPAQIKVIRHVRPKYACHACEGSGDEDAPSVRIAPAPQELLPKSIASAGLVSHIIAGKYCDGLPLYRQEKMFARIGVEISRASMARWIMCLSERLSPLLQLIDERIRSGPLIQMDETRMQVHHEPGREDHSQSYMWVARGGDPEKPLIRYLYHPSRGEQIPQKYLSGYKGYLQTDAYKAYLKVAERQEITHVLCLAHARRKFDEATKVSGGSPAAREFIALIQKIYRVEKELRTKDLSEQEFIQQRRESVMPLIEKLEKKLDKKSGQVAPSTALGKAVNYSRDVLPKITRYLDLACLTPDNNAAERAIRPFVIGRKNWLHADTPRGAHASATFYSLIESAKSASLEPYWYIRYVLQKLSKIESSASVWEELLPEKLTPEMLLTSSF
jgi:transposase